MRVSASREIEGSPNRPDAAVLHRTPRKHRGLAGGRLRPLLKHWAFTIQIGLNSVVGYAFLRIMSVKFGTSADKSAFDIAYSVPFMILNVSGFAWLHSVVTTQFTRQVVDDPAGASESFSTTLNVMLAIGAGLLLLCAMFSARLTELLAPGLSAEVRNETRVLMLLMLPLIFTLGVSTYISAVMTAYGVPVAMELCQLVCRLGVVICAWVAGFRISLYEVAAGLVVFSAAGLLIEIGLLKAATGLRYRPVMRWEDRVLRTIARQSTGLIFAALMAQCGMGYLRRLATFDSNATTAAISYALATNGFLALLIGKPLALAIGPDYVNLCANRDWAAARRTLLRLLLFATAIGLALTVLVNSLAASIIATLWGGGRFNAHSVELTAALFSPINWSLTPAVALWLVLFPLMNSGKLQSAAVIYSAGYVVEIALCYVLFPAMGGIGLAWAYTLSIAFQAVLGSAHVYRELSWNHQSAALEHHTDCPSAPLVIQAPQP